MFSDGATQNERDYLKKLLAERIDPVTGEAHYYLIKVRKNRTNYQLTIPRTEHTKEQFPTLENHEVIKIITQKDSNDKYIVLKEIDAKA